MNNNHGFTTIEALLVLFIVSMSITLLSPMVLQIQKLYNFPRVIDDTLAIYQLRIDVAMASTCYVKDDVLYLTLAHKNYMISYQNHKLCKQIGNEIYLEHIDNAIFTHKKDGIYLRYIRGKKTYESYLGK